MLKGLYMHNSINSITKQAIVMYLSLSENILVRTENMNFVNNDNYLYLSHDTTGSIDVINNGMVSVIY